MENALPNERRIKDAAAARSLWSKLRAASLSRREKWAQVQNQLDGAPPMLNADLVAKGQSWRTNINFRDAASTLEQVMVSYWQLLHDTTTLAAVSYLEPGDPHADRWEHIFQQNFNRFVDEWGADYVRNYLLFSQNHVAFGVGIAFWNDRYSPRWEALRVGEIEVPGRSKASVEKLSVVGIRQEMELESLWDLVRTPAARTAAARRGWNPAEIERVLALQLLNQDGHTQAIVGSDTLEVQRLLRNNVLGVTTGHDPLKLVHILIRDYDGKVSRMIFTEGRGGHADEGDAFLFDDTTATERPARMNEVIAAVFFDAGNGDWWGTKGFGVKNFQIASTMNRLKSRAVDRTLLDGLNFKDLSDGVREIIPITSHGPFNFLPKDIEQVQTYPTGRSILETIEMLDAQSSFNNARYRDQGRQIAQTGTATQATLLAGLQSQVDVANATLYLRQVARNIFTEQFRRLRLRDNPDEDAKKFRRRCLDDAGMPENVFYSGEIAVRTGADPGAANLLLQGQKALEAMALPDANRRWMQEKYISANFGASAVQKALIPVDSTSDIKSQRLALIENSEMGQGMPMPVDPQDNHTAHLPVHLQPLEVIVHAHGASGKLNPDALIALQNAIPHLDEHFGFLAQDKLQESLYRALMPRFLAVKSAAQGIFRMVEQMHRNVMQAQAQAQQGGPSPQGPEGGDAMPGGFGSGGGYSDAGAGDGAGGGGAGGPQ
jgi:hypothetical protein